MEERKMKYQDWKRMNEIHSKNLQDKKIRLIFWINLPHNIKEKIVQKYLEIIEKEKLKEKMESLELDKLETEYEQRKLEKLYRRQEAIEMNDSDYSSSD